MDPNSRMRYDIITGNIKKIKEQLNDPIRADWRPILMATTATFELAVVLEMPKQATGYEHLG